MIFISLRSNWSFAIRCGTLSKGKSNLQRCIRIVRSQRFYDQLMFLLLSAEAFLKQLRVLIDVLIEHPVRKCPEHVDVRPVKQRIATGLDDCAV